MATFNLPDVSQHVFFREVPGRGWGVFAQYNIPAGTELWNEEWMMSIGQPETSRLVVYEMFRDFVDLPTRQLLLQLNPAGGRERIDAMIRDIDSECRQSGKTCGPEAVEEAAKVNALFEDNAYYRYDPNIHVKLLFVVSSFINHSCTPNAYQHVKKKHRSVRAIAPIAANEEVTISYISVTDNRRTRAQELLRWQFECSCPACDRSSRAGLESEVRRNQLMSWKLDIQVLEQNQGDGEQKIFLYGGCVQSADLEGLCDPTIGLMHERLADLYATRKEFANAARHQRRATEIFRNAYGVDNGQVLHMEKKIQEFLVDMDLQDYYTGVRGNPALNMPSGSGAPLPGGDSYTAPGQWPGGSMPNHNRHPESLPSRSNSRQNSFGSDGRARKGRGFFK